MTKYIWERPFRLRILAACLQDTWFEHTGIHTVKPEYFDTIEEQQLVEFITYYQAKYNHPPGEVDLIAEYTGHDKSMIDLLVEVIDLAETEDLAYTKQKAMEFAKTQALRNAILYSNTLLNQGKTAEEALSALVHVAEINISPHEWESPTNTETYDFENTVYIVQNLLKQGKVNLLFGKAGIHKTWLLLYIAACIATGKPFLNYNCIESHILWIDEENREDEMMRRLYAFRTAMTVEERSKFDANFTFRTLSAKNRKRFKLQDQTDVHKLVQTIHNKQDKPVLVILDSLGTVSHKSDKSISDNPQAIEVMNIMADICIETNATLVAVHHPTKAGDMFGGIYLTNLVDMTIEATEIKSDSGRKLLKLTLPKNRLGITEKEELLVEFTTDGNDNLGRAIDPKFVEVIDIQLEQTKSTIQQSKLEKVLYYLSENKSSIVGKSRNKAAAFLRSELHIGRDTCSIAVDKLIAEGVYINVGSSDTDPNNTLQPGYNYPNETGMKLSENGNNYTASLYCYTEPISEAV